MRFRSARLNALLGIPVDELTAAAIRSLVGSDAAEAADLDYKAELYGNSEASRRALATDVAALANTAGGLVLLGIDEDEHACPQAAPGVALSDAEQRRMAQIIASQIAPVPRFEIRPLPDGEGSSTGFYVIAVERTNGAPHAVTVNEGFRYPRRNGATTEYLSEPEVAEAYRARLAGLSDQRARLDEVHQRGVDAMEANDFLYVAVAAVPEIRGFLRVDQANLRAFERAEIGTSPTIFGISVSTQRTFVDRGHFTADGAADRASKSKFFRFDAHGDGSAYFGWLANFADRIPGQPYLVSDELLVLGVLSALLKAGRHAQNASASGSVSLRTSIVHVTANRPAELAHSRNGSGKDRSWDGRVLMQSEPFHGVVDLDDITDPGPRLVATAASVCNGLFQSFGVAECPQLTREGQIRWPDINNEWRAQMKAWAAASGVEIVENTLPE